MALEWGSRQGKARPLPAACLHLQYARVRSHANGEMALLRWLPMAGAIVIPSWRAEQATAASKASVGLTPRDKPEGMGMRSEGAGMADARDTRDGAAILESILGLAKVPPHLARLLSTHRGPIITTPPIMVPTIQPP